MIEKYLALFNDLIKSIVISNNDGKTLNSESAISIISNEFNKIKIINGTLYLIGNGGSSGIASHASVDLLNTCKIKAYPLTDNSQLTCFANDFGYENVYSKLLENVLTSNDILIAISSSGSSKNIINAANIAHQKNTFILTLSGFKPDNPLRQYGNINIWLNSNHYGMVEIGHALILHYITDSFSNLSLI